MRCDATTTYVNKRGIEQWLKKSEGYLCRKCYYKYYQIAEGNPRRLSFTPNHKNLTFREPIRLGVCSRCFRSKERGEIKTTVLHHTSYDQKDPLANTLELCIPCHKHIHPSRKKLIP